MRQRTKQRTSKRLRRFHWAGLVAGLVGSLVAEPVISLLQDAAPSKPAVRADIVFVLDGTTSLADEMNAIKRGMTKFVRGLRSVNISPQVGLVVFRDVASDGPPEVIRFGGDAFSGDGEVLASAISGIELRGGGDDMPESSLDGLAKAARYPFRPDAHRIVVLVTDAPPKDSSGPAAARIGDLFAQKRIEQLHCFVPTGVAATYSPLRTRIAGQHIPLEEVVWGLRGFEDILPAIMRDLGIKPVPSMLQCEVRPWSVSRVLLVAALWTALVATLLALGLTAAQAWYDQTQLDPRSLLAALAGAFLVGSVAGLVGQSAHGLFAPVPVLGFIGKAFGWVVLGSVVGLGLSRIVPTLMPRSGLRAGGSGGLIGIVVFLTAATAGIGDPICRILAVLCLGFALGWMIVRREIIAWRAASQPQCVSGRQIKATTIQATMLRKEGSRWWGRRS